MAVRLFIYVFMYLCINMAATRLMCACVIDIELKKHIKIYVLLFVMVNSVFCMCGGMRLSHEILS